MQYNPKKYTYSNDKILIIPYIVRTLSSRIIIIMSLLKRKGNNIQLFSKHSATNIREDRIDSVKSGRVQVIPDRVRTLSPRSMR